MEQPPSSSRRTDTTSGSSASPRRPAGDEPFHARHLALIIGPMVAPSRAPGTVVLAMYFGPPGWTFLARSRSKIIPWTFQNQSANVPKRWDPNQRVGDVSAGQRACSHTPEARGFRPLIHLRIHGTLH